MLKLTGKKKNNNFTLKNFVKAFNWISNIEFFFITSYCNFLESRKKILSLCIVESDT